MKYRNELKFLITNIQAEKIRYRLESLLCYDTNMIGDSYTVRSLYFDDIYDTCLFENLSGIDKRTKYRLRIYNGNSEYILLEKKCKYRGMTQKSGIKISLDDYKYVIEGIACNPNEPLFTELFYEMEVKYMRPKSIVEYDRCAMINEIGNLRVTFDRNLRGSLEAYLFLNGIYEDFELIMPEDMVIMEIKYDELLPHYILQAVDINSLQRQSFSKYCMVRQKIK